MDELLFTPEEINERLTSNFDGDDDDIYLSYDGADEDLYSDFFGARPTTAKDTDMGKTSTMVAYRFTNTSSTQKTVAICTGSLTTETSAVVYLDTTLKYKHPLTGAVLAAPVGSFEGQVLHFNYNTQPLQQIGFPVDAILDDGIVYAELADPSKYLLIEPISSNGSAKHFRDFISKNPVLMSGFDVQSNVKTAYQGTLSLKNADPFKSYEERRVNISRWFTQAAYNTDVVEVPESFQLDNNTVSTIVIPANSVVSFTFYGIRVESASKALENKVKIEKGIKPAPKIKPKPRPATGMKQAKPTRPGVKR